MLPASLPSFLLPTLPFDITSFALSLLLVFRWAPASRPARCCCSYCPALPCSLPSARRVWLALEPWPALWVDPARLLPAQPPTPGSNPRRCCWHAQVSPSPLRASPLLSTTGTASRPPRRAAPLPLPLPACCSRRGSAARLAARRTNTSYDRWLQGLKSWTDISIRSRDTLRQLLAYCAAPAAEGGAAGADADAVQAASAAAKWMVAFARSLKAQVTEDSDLPRELKVTAPAGWLGDASDCVGPRRRPKMLGVRLSGAPGSRGGGLAGKEALPCLGCLARSCWAQAAVGTARSRRQVLF